MTPSAFISWQTRLGWNNAQAGRALHGSRGGVIAGYRSGARKIQPSTEMLCLIIEAAMLDGAGAQAAHALLMQEGRKRIAAAGVNMTRGGWRHGQRRVG